MPKSRITRDKKRSTKDKKSKKYKKSQRGGGSLESAWDRIEEVADAVSGYDDTMKEFKEKVEQIDKNQNKHFRKLGSIDLLWGHSGAHQGRLAELESKCAELEAEVGPRLDKLEAEVAEIDEMKKNIESLKGDFDKVISFVGGKLIRDKARASEK